MQMFGIQIERKTDILALSAFLLSAGGIATQAGLFLYVFWRGPIVEVFPPERILIRAHDLSKLEDTWVRIGSRMAYTNSGSVGYNTVLSKEIVEYELGGTVYRQAWQSFDTFDYVADGLVSIKSEPANPVPVVAGSALAHDTYFFPFREFCQQKQQACNEWRNYLKFGDFVQSAKKVDHIHFTLTAKMYGENDETTTCRIMIDANLIDQLKGRGWHAPSCWPVATNVAGSYGFQSGAFAAEVDQSFLVAQQVPADLPTSLPFVQKPQRNAEENLSQSSPDVARELSTEGPANPSDGSASGIAQPRQRQLPLRNTLETPVPEDGRLLPRGINEARVASDDWYSWYWAMPPELPPGPPPELPPRPPPELPPDRPEDLPLQR